MTPSSSLNSGDVTCAANFKKANDRVTHLAYANALGSRSLPLVFINKSVKPRYFKHMDMSSLPVHYSLQNKSWMASNIFDEWFQQPFVASVRNVCSDNGLEKKSLLLLDNAPLYLSLAT